MSTTISTGFRHAHTRCLIQCHHRMPFTITLDPFPVKASRRVNTLTWLLRSSIAFRRVTTFACKVSITSPRFLNHCRANLFGWTCCCSRVLFVSGLFFFLNRISKSAFSVPVSSQSFSVCARILNCLIFVFAKLLNV